MTDDQAADIETLIQLIPDVMRTSRQRMLLSFGRSDMTPVQWMLLGKLARVGPCNATQIGTLMGITSGSVTSTTERMIARGLIERRRDDSDRRVVIFSVTEAGRAALQTYADAQRENLTTLSEKIGADKTKQLIGLLREIRSVMAIAPGEAHAMTPPDSPCDDPQATEKGVH